MRGGVGGMFVGGRGVGRMSVGDGRGVGGAVSVGGGRSVGGTFGGGDGLSLPTIVGDNVGTDTVGFGIEESGLLITFGGSVHSGNADLLPKKLVRCIVCTGDAWYALCARLYTLRCRLLP